MLPLVQIEPRMYLHLFYVDSFLWVSGEYRLHEVLSLTGQEFRNRIVSIQDFFIEGGGILILKG